MGKHILGVTPTKPGFAEYEVRPNLSGLEWIDGVVPTPHGEIHVSCTNGTLSVTGDGHGVGTLVLPDGVRHTLPQYTPMTIYEVHFQ